MDNNIDALKRELELEEGKRKTAYKDSEGLWTIAIGHRLNEQNDAELEILGIEDDLDDWEGFEISEEQIYRLLDHDVEETLRRLRNAFDDDLLQSLAPKRFMAVFQMCYQIGSVTGFPAFVEAVKNEDWDRAADEMLFRNGLKKEVWSRWHKQTPGRCEKMAGLMRTGSVEETNPAGTLPADETSSEALSVYSSTELLEELIRREGAS